MQKVTRGVTRRQQLECAENRTVRLLSQPELRLLKEILWRWNPTLVALLDQASVSTDEREELRGALAEELVSRGLESDSEPNRYGLQIEDLIDKIGSIPETPITESKPKV